MTVPIIEFELDSGDVVRGFGPIVAFVGPNGAGKTRILERIDSRFDDRVCPVWLKELDHDFKKTNASPTQLAEASQRVRQNRRDRGRWAYQVLQQVCNDWLDATSSETNLSDAERTRAIEHFTFCNDLVTRLLGEPLQPKRYGLVHMYGFPIDNNHLSPGQRRVLQFVTRLLIPPESERPLVFLLDEPELHLHPKAVIELVNILGTRPHAQVFIATHCLPFIASLPADSVYLMRGGKVLRASDKPDDVVESLLGGPDNAESLRVFLDRPADLALHRFAVESLCPPGTASHRDGDPQTNQVREQVDALRSARGDLPLRLLDWGAGQARLGITLLHECGLKDSLEYAAFDTDADNLAKCREALERHGLPTDGKTFDKLSELKNAFDGRPFDVIALVNVLHEIPPEKWVETFRQIDKCLADDGILVILEDQNMPVGEHAHECGFVVLHDAALRRLFGDESTRSIQMSTPTEPEKYRNRLTAFAVPKRCLSQVTNQTKGSALSCVRDHARTRVDELRRESREKGAKAGRELARYLLLFANADLAGA